MPGSNGSSWTRPDRGPVRHLILEGEPEASPLWDARERPPDPMAWRVRTLIEHYLSKNHADILEDRFFMQKSYGDIAEERGVTRHAVVLMVQRAMDNFVAMFGRHLNDLLDVPVEEM